MNKHKRIAIIGGGPAGSFLALNLTKEGVPVTIFDPSHPREKPCGGVLSQAALQLFPLDNRLESANIIKSYRFQSPFNNQFSVEQKRKTITVNRREYDLLILNEAIKNGAIHHKEYVRKLKYEEDGWHIFTDESKRNFDIVCGADGVRSLVARTVGCSLSQDDLGFTAVTYVENLGEKSEILIRFGNHVGYSWVINRKNIASVGIGAPLNQREKALDEFREFCKEINLSTDNIKLFNWMIPLPRSRKFLEKDKAGADWLLVGDAAGFCDPLTGEGIHLALESGYLAAQAILEENLKVYDLLWRKAFGANLRFGITNRPMLTSRYVTELLLDCLQRNPRDGMSFFKLL